MAGRLDLPRLRILNRLAFGPPGSKTGPGERSTSSRSGLPNGPPSLLAAPTSGCWRS